MVNSNDDLRIDAKRIKAEIENLKYDRDLVVQQKGTFPYGFFNKKLLNHKLLEIDRQLIQLRQKLEYYNDLIASAEPGAEYHSIEAVKQLILSHSRYLQKLRLQQAKMGIQTPPPVLIEIEDIEEEIKELQLQLKSFSS